MSRKIHSEVSGSRQKLLDSFPPPWLRRVSPRSKALVPLNTDNPLSLKLDNMCSATSSHPLFGLYLFDPHHFFSDPSPGNEQCPCGNLRAYPATIIKNSQCMILCFLSLPIQYHCTLTSRWLMIGTVNKFTLHFNHHSLNLSENL